MTQRNVILTDELDGFVTREVESGRYVDANDVIQQALRALAREEREDDEKMAFLLTAIDQGDAGGMYEGDPIADIRRNYGLPTQA